MAFLTPCMLGAQRPRSQLEVFTSMKYIEEAGDLVGTEVLLLHTHGGACVSYQSAEGVPGRVRIVRADVRGDSLIFLIPPDTGYTGGTRRLEQVGPVHWFRGRMTASGLRAQIEGDVEPTWLPRRRRPYFESSRRQLLLGRC